MAQNPATIPFYGLYGDNFVDGDPGFVHIEDIATRSSGLDWIIQPHRHNRLFQLLCIFDSQLEINLEGTTHNLVGSWIVTLPVGAIHGFRFQPGSQGFVLTLKDTVLAEELPQGYEGSGSELFQTPQLIEYVADDPGLTAFLEYVGKIREEFDYQRPGRHQALALLSRLAVLSLHRQLRHQQFLAAPGGKELQALGQFRALLEIHYREHWPVSRYASQLHISTSTLARLCHKMLGSPPKQLIDERMLSEIRRRLVYTRQSLDEIAYTLGFKDYPYFSRFFRQRQGMTAGEYRKQADAGQLPEE
ncbi:helix-turn-helix domain-containing protein [Parahaliea maris]|nr:helix-turn-helix domain-containing protein [Parahaliea maris]